MTNSPHIGDEQVQSYLEGLLSKPDARVVEGHFSECSACRALSESYTSLSTALGELERLSPPANFTVGVLARIDQGRRADARLSMTILGVAMVLASTLFALAGPAAWGTALSDAGSMLGSAASALQLGVNALLPVLYALQLETMIAFSFVALLLFFCLSRALSPRSGGPA